MTTLRQDRARIAACQIDASRIVRSIYQGSKPPVGGAVRRCGFDLVVLSAMEFQPPDDAYPGVVVYHAPIDDAVLSRRELKIAVGAAEFAAQVWKGGGRVLITCQAGRNRSGLITALTLHLLTRESGAKIVRHIQRHRKNALTNQNFVAFLEKL